MKLIVFSVMGLLISNLYCVSNKLDPLKNLTLKIAIWHKNAIKVNTSKKNVISSLKKLSNDNELWKKMKKLKESEKTVLFNGIDEFAVELNSQEIEKMRKIIVRIDKCINNLQHDFASASENSYLEAVNKVIKNNKEHKNTKNISKKI